MSIGKRQATKVRTLQQPLQPTPTAPIVNTPPKDAQPQAITRPH